MVPEQEPPDLRSLLTSWPYDPERTTRVVRCADGREVLQVRLPMGVEQYELEGRPDGRRPHNCESVLDFRLARLEELKAQGREAEFRLSAAECSELEEEGTLYYYRYLHLFQIGDWKRTVRDTDRNLRLFDLLRRHAERPEDATSMEKWRPYIIRMNGVARAMIALGAKHHARALEIVKKTIGTLRALRDMDDETFRFERQRSLKSLEALAAQIARSRPLTEAERLEQELSKAVAAEEFEKAAVLRDKIRELQARGPSARPA